MINLALFYGGESSEWQISVLSGQNTAPYLSPDAYHVYEILLHDHKWTVVRACGREVSVPVDKNDFSVTIDGQHIAFEAALLMIHGTPGENGLLASYLEMMQIPHTGCPAGVGFYTFDKYTCKCILRRNHVLVPREFKLTRSILKNNPTTCLLVGQIEAEIGPMPWFIKPNAAGSSFGASLVTTQEQFGKALENAFTEDDVILIEEYIKGREFTNGIMKTRHREYLLPVTEIIPASERPFFDYEAKYNGHSQEVTPAVISQNLSVRIQTISSYIYDCLGCKGVVRMDYIVRDDSIYFLEVNTIPGMTAMSLIPQQIKAAGLSVAEFVDAMIDDTCRPQKQN